jgi:hypothetical protein
VLLYYWLATNHAASTPAERLAGTVIGIALTFVGVAVIRIWSTRRERS